MRVKIRNQLNFRPCWQSIGHSHLLICFLILLSYNDNSTCDYSSSSISLTFFVEAFCFRMYCIRSLGSTWNRFSKSSPIVSRLECYLILFSTCVMLSSFSWSHDRSIDRKSQFQSYFCYQFIMASSVYHTPGDHYVLRQFLFLAFLKLSSVTTHARIMYDTDYERSRLQSTVSTISIYIFCCLQQGKQKVSQKLEVGSNNAFIRASKREPIWKKLISQPPIRFTL